MFTKFKEFWKPALFVLIYLIICVGILLLAYLINTILSVGASAIPECTALLSIVLVCLVTIGIKRVMFKLFGESIMPVMKQAGFIFTIIAFLLLVFIGVGLIAAISAFISDTSGVVEGIGGGWAMLASIFLFGLFIVIVAAAIVVFAALLVYGFICCLVLNLCVKYEKVVLVISAVSAVIYIITALRAMNYEAMV